MDIKNVHVVYFHQCDVTTELNNETNLVDNNLHFSWQVTGELLDHLTSWDVLRSALPVGTVSGAPKVFIMIPFPLSK